MLLDNVLGKKRCIMLINFERYNSFFYLFEDDFSAMLCYDQQELFLLFVPGRLV